MGSNANKLLHHRSKVPPRPAGQRTEPEPNTTFQGFGFGDGGFQMSLGIGAFPFGIFTSTFNFGTNLRSQSMCMYTHPIIHLNLIEMIQRIHVQGLKSQGGGGRPENPPS